MEPCPTVLDSFSYRSESAVYRWKRYDEWRRKMATGRACLHWRI